MKVRAVSLLLVVALMAAVPGPREATSSVSVPALQPAAATALAAGRSVTLRLGTLALRMTAAPREMLAPDAGVWVVRDGHTTPAPRAATTTYIGRLTPDPGLSVRLSIRGGVVEGLVIDRTGSGWVLLPRPDGGADARAFESLDRDAPGGEEGLHPPQPMAAAGSPSPAAAPGTLVLRLALEADHLFWTFNRNTWQQKMEELASYLEAVYDPQLDLRVQITDLSAWTTPDPYTAPNACNPGKLEQVTDYWLRNRGEVPRDAVHLFTPSLTGNFIGCAWIQRLNDPYAVGVSRIVSSPVNLLNNVNLLAHEIGHNFGGIHERSVGAYAATGNSSRSGTPPYSIMNPIAEGGVLQFSELRGVRSPTTGWELNNRDPMRTYAESRLGR
ncbi:MAG TPA: M12 family metallo-peptidase [Actinomycetota bacterium]|nr:M12 family metallo-peptidase [Actinomycetota bacterium]